MLNVSVFIAQISEKKPQLLYILQKVFKIVLVAFSQTSSADQKLDIGWSEFI